MDFTELKSMRSKNPFALDGAFNDPNTLSRLSGGHSDASPQGKRYYSGVDPLPSQDSISTLLGSVHDEHPNHIDSYEPASASSASDVATVSVGGKPRSKRERSRNHTPRPPNSFILYRREKHIEIMAQYKGEKTLNNNVISKIVATMWREETPDVKAIFAQKAADEKLAHMLKYPDYKYKPRKGVAKSKLVSKKSLDRSKGFYGAIAAMPHQRPAQLMTSQNFFQQRHGGNMHPFPQYNQHHQYAHGQMHLGQPSVGHQGVPGFSMTQQESINLAQIYDGQHEYLRNDSIMPAWNTPTSCDAIWEVGLDHKPLGSLSPDNC